MDLRDFTVQTMVNISGPWLDPEQDRRMLASLPLLAALLPAIEEAHEGLKSTQRRGSGLQQELKTVIEKGIATDTLHDRKIRGSWNLLGALAELTDDPERAASVLDLRDRLIPAGLRAITRSYTEEAGDAKLLPSRLDGASTKLLKKIKTLDGTLDEVMDAWIAAALALEQIEAEREGLEQKIKAGAGGVTSRDVVNARNAWIRAVRAVETNLALEKGATDEIVEQLLGRLRREEAKAARRTRKAGSEADGNGAPAPNNAGGEAPAPTPGASAPSTSGSPGRATEPADE